MERRQQEKKPKGLIFQAQWDPHQSDLQLKAEHYTVDVVVRMM